MGLFYTYTYLIFAWVALLRGWMGRVSNRWQLRGVCPESLEPLPAMCPSSTDCWPVRTTQTQSPSFRHWAIILLNIAASFTFAFKYFIWLLSKRIQNTVIEGDALGLSNSRVIPCQVSQVGRRLVTNLDEKITWTPFHQINWNQNILPKEIRFFLKFFKILQTPEFGSFHLAVTLRCWLNLVCFFVSSGSIQTGELCKWMVHLETK